MQSNTAVFENQDISFANFSAETLTGFNKNLYIHDKFLLVDPLGDDPVVLTGSANFSAASIPASPASAFSRDAL